MALLIITITTLSLYTLATYQDETNQQKHDKYIIELKNLKK
jgi:hypothetical protein